MTRLVTFNVNGIKVRLPALLQFLAESQPDIVCLQELKTTDDTFPHAEIEAAGYGAIWHGQKGFNGVAVLARGAQPLERRRGLPGDPDDSHSRYLEADVHGVTIASIYLPNGNPQPGPKFDYKLAWFERLIAHAATLVAGPQPVVLAGDYNVVPTNDKTDIYNYKSWLSDALLQPQSRAAFERLKALGFTDALRHLYPDTELFTYWDFFRQRWERNSGLRIDHFLVNAPALARLREGGVHREVRGRERPSDHAPAWIALAG